MRSLPPECSPLNFYLRRECQILRRKPGFSAKKDICPGVASVVERKAHENKLKSLHHHSPIPYPSGADLLFVHPGPQYKGAPVTFSTDEEEGVSLDLARRTMYQDGYAGAYGCMPYCTFNHRLLAQEEARTVRLYEQARTGSAPQYRRVAESHGTGVLIGLPWTY